MAMSRPFRIFLKVLLAFLVLLAACYVALAWYINNNRPEVLKAITAELNQSLSGTLTIGSMEPTFLEGFPQVSMRLHNVVLRDSLYATHKQTLLKAGELNIAVNTLALIRGTIEIRKIGIRNAALNLYTTPDRYSNTAVFRKDRKAKTEGGSGSFPELRRLSLHNVSLAIDNRRMGKLYKFTVASLNGTIDYTSGGWEADASLSATAHSMAFNTARGSFIKNKTLDGRFDISYNEDEGYITFEPNRLEIGGEDFTIGASLQVADTSADFTISIRNERILWGNAARLLSPNITAKLEMFDLSEPIKVSCDLVGDFNEKGDPLISVRAEVKDNTLKTPGGSVEECSFTKK